MSTSTLSARIKQSNSRKADVEELTEKITTTLRLDGDPADMPHDTEEDSSEEDWEKLADKEVDTPPEPVKKPVPAPTSTLALELYDFEVRTPMHQLVKEFTSIVDPTGTMPFRPKMVNQSLLLTFQNPKHGRIPLDVANSSCHCIIQLFLHHPSKSDW
jgi:hypothetical protein